MSNLNLQIAFTTTSGDAEYRQMQCELQKRALNCSLWKEEDRKLRVFYDFESFLREIFRFFLTTMLTPLFFHFLINLSGLIPHRPWLTLDVTSMVAAVLSRGFNQVRLGGKMG
jgi:hypothetical protein